MKLARGEAALLLTDPLFREGYLDAHRLRDRVVSLGWSVEERRAYGAGYDFGSWCRVQDFRPRLSRGGVADSEGAALLLRCSMSGALGVAA